MNRTFLMVGRMLVLSVFAVTVAEAQATSAAGSRSGASEVPKEYVPPAGMCRIWLDAVPAAQQPAPTDCSIAVRNKPPNGKVIYGPKKGAASGKEVDKLPIKRFDTKGKGGLPVIPGVTIPPGQDREPGDNKRSKDDQLFGNRRGNLPVSSFAALGSPARGSSTCLDRDADGWCDDFSFGPPACLDRGRDGQCDDSPTHASLSHPQVLPVMQSAMDLVQGRQSEEVAQWLGTNDVIARLPDQGRGTPWRAIFLDADNNQLLQVWTDRNKDGQVDRVEMFHNGERVRLIQR